MKPERENFYVYEGQWKPRKVEGEEREERVGPWAFQVTVTTGGGRGGLGKVDYGDWDECGSCVTGEQRLGVSGRSRREGHVKSVTWVNYKDLCDEEVVVGGM